MIDVIRWLFVVEVIGLAFLPLTVWVLRYLPDRGYAFSKLVGLLLLVWVVWLAGNALPIAGPPWLALAVLIVAGAASWWLWGAQTIASLRDLGRVIAVEEVLFLAAFLVWTWMRAFVFHPGIGHTEQYMDLTFLQGSLRSASYPPYDPWMSGHSINYYYFGYLLYATVVKLSGVAPAIGYNLALSSVFAFTVVGCFSVAFALSRKLTWALLGPAFVALAGNWHSVFVQVPSGDSPGTYFWFWDSTRVVGSTFIHGALDTNLPQPTINEFPFFSFMLGDLHPHVMALPITILAVAIGVALVVSPVTIRVERNFATLALLAVAAVTAGSLYATNSWDFPTYLIVIAACIAVNAYTTDTTINWWRSSIAAILALAVAAVLAFAPFYLRFQSPAHGLGWVTTPSNLGQFLQVFGMSLLAVAILLVVFGVIFQPTQETAEVDDEEVAQRTDTALEAGQARISDTLLLFLGAGALLLALGFRSQHWTLGVLLVIAVAAGIMLWRILNTDEPRVGDAVALIGVLLACLLLAGTEVVYLRDAFDGGSAYRMNTVFKFYYQAWTLLGLAAAYGAYRSFELLKRHFSLPLAAAALGIILLGLAGGGVYTILAPRTANIGGGTNSLDGMSLLRSAHPTDAAAIAWLNRHVSGNPVVLEASNANNGQGTQYNADFARVATFSGLPSVMGWPGHEGEWRGDDPEIGMRDQDVTTIYTTKSAALAKRLLHRYGVRYVFVGDTEHTIVKGHLAKFGTFMRPVFRDGSTVIYTW